MESRRIFVFVLLAAAFVVPYRVSANELDPVRTLNLQTTVAVRETVAAVAVRDNKTYLLVTDRAPTGRSAILVETDTHGRQPQWQDLKVPAGALVKAGSFVAALSPIPGGLRLLEPMGGEIRSTDLTGLTASTVGSGSRLVRLLGNGDLAVHDVSARGLSSPRHLATSAELKVPEACATCGTEKFTFQGSHVICMLPGDRLALVHRSSASIKIVDLNTSRVIVSRVLNNEDLSFMVERWGGAESHRF